MSEREQFYQQARERIENWTELRLNIKGNLELLRRLDNDMAPVAESDITASIHRCLPELYYNSTL